MVALREASVAAPATSKPAGSWSQRRFPANTGVNCLNPCGEKQLPQASITRIMQSPGGLLLGPGGRFLAISRRLPPSSYSCWVDQGECR